MPIAHQKPMSFGGGDHDFFPEMSGQGLIPSFLERAKTPVPCASVAAPGLGRGGRKIGASAGFRSSSDPQKPARLKQSQGSCGAATR